MNTALKVGLLAGAALFLASKFTDLGKKIGVNLDTISINKALTQGAGYLKLFFNVNLSINNSSSVQGDVKGGALNLFVKDKLLATVTNIKPFSIAANQTAKISIPVGVNSLSLVSSILAIIDLFKTGGSIAVSLKGEILTSYGTVTINESKTVVV